MIAAPCETLELDPARDRLVRDGALPYFAFPAGRAGEPWTHEVVALDVPPAAVVAFARAVAGSSPHLVSAVGVDGPAAVGAYAAAGYAPWGRGR